MQVFGAKLSKICQRTNNVKYLDIFVGKTIESATNLLYNTFTNALDAFWVAVVGTRPAN